MEIIKLRLDQLKPYEKNAKRHTDEQIQHIINSIEQFGMNDPIGIWGEKNVIVEGHGRYFALKKMGIKDVDCIRLDHLSDEERKAYTLVHNQATLETPFDDDLLKIELDGIFDIDMSELGFDLDFGINEEPAEIVEDEAPEEVETRCKIGDIWQLGNHRLICGDSTDVAVIDRLMDGVKADCVFTDPPYNVDYSDKNKFLNGADKGNRIQKDIENDSFADDEQAKDNLWKPAFQNMADYAKDDCSIYVTMPQGGTHMMMMMMSVHDAGWQVKHELIWLKNNHVLGRTDYYYKHEPILYGWNKKHKFYGKGEFDKSVWEIPKPQKSDLHPTMKPIELIANALQNSTKENDVVLDVFGGSGSTLIASEQLNRKCYMCELDPHYCDVIIERWENFTGSKAVRLQGE